MRTGRSGSALLTVLWLTAALSAIGLAVANNVRGETERTSTDVDDTRSYFFARGAIERAALHILWRGYTGRQRPAALLPTTGQPVMNLDFPDAQVTVEIIPESAKLNFNSIRPEDLLAASGGPAECLSTMQLKLRRRFSTGGPLPIRCTRVRSTRFISVSLRLFCRVMRHTNRTRNSC